MTLVLILFILGIFIYSLYRIKEKYNPLTLFTGFWVIILFFSRLELYNIKKADESIYLIVITGILSYTLGCFIASKFNKEPVFHNGLQIDNYKDNSINYRVFNIVCIVITLIMTTYFIRVAYTMLLGSSLNYIRSNFTEFIIRNEIERITWIFIIYPLALSIMPAGLYAFYVDRKKIRFFCASLLNTIFLSICTGGRVYLMFYAIQFAFFTKYTKYKINLKSRIYRTLALIVVTLCCIAIMMYISNERRIQTSPLESLYSYFVGCLPYFDFQLSQIRYVNYGYGMYFLYSPITFGLMFLKNIGLIDYPSSFLAAQETVNFLQEYTRIGNNYFNAFTTCFYYFYIDGGYIGVIIESIIYGFFCFNIFKSLRVQAQARNIIIYGIILITIFTSMVRWQFARPEFFMSLIYIFLLTSNYINKVVCNAKR